MSEQKTGHRKQLEDFIISYRNEPSLWNTKSKEYHNRNIKNAAYNRLIEKYKVIDPDANRYTLVKKINNLRSSVRKELNKMRKSSEAGDIYTPTLWYFDLFRFLHHEEVLSSSISNIKYEDENEESIILNVGTVNSERDVVSPNYSDIDEDSPTQNNSDSEQETPSTKRRPEQTTFADVLSLQEHFKRPKVSESRFEVFGKHIGMKMQELEKEQRIIAEKLINDTLFLAEMGSLTLSHAIKKNDVNTSV